MTQGVSETPSLNAMTVDVEDYFQVQAFAGCVKRDCWDEYPSRVERNTLHVLDLFSRYNVRATFFTLGWVAERYPSIVRQIVAAGHELASHGYGHELVCNLSPAEFRQDVVRAKDVLEAAGGMQVKGYRAPTFSIGAATPWAFRILDETGHAYSSSSYPVRHDLYGDPDAPRFPYHPNHGALLEIPMTTLKIGRRNVPVAGGGYFRLAPYSVYRAALNRFRSRERKAGMFYIHPWEIDPEQPRIDGISLKSKFRHYVNIGKVAGRLDRLLQDFEWGRIDTVFKSELARA